MQIIKTFIVLFTALFFISSCAPLGVQHGSIGSSQEYRTVYGVVRSMTPIKVNSKVGTGIGAITGAILGRFLGNTIGGGSGQALAAAAGAVGGSFAGGAAGNKIGGHNAYEIMVQADNGNSISIIEHESVDVHVGQRVRLLLGHEYSKIEPI